MRPLFEKYRPARWDEVVGQDKALARLDVLRQRGGLSGRSYFLTGASGTGKTTIARLIAAEIAEPWNVVEVDGGDVTAGFLDDLERVCHTFGMGADKCGRAWIVNEAHGLRAAAVRRLLVILEALPPHCVVVFTTTHDGADSLWEDHIDAGPLLSRCIDLPLTTQGLCKAFAARCREIAQAEGLDGQPVEKYERLLKDKGNNFRAALQAVDSGCMML